MANPPSPSPQNTAYTTNSMMASGWIQIGTVAELLIQPDVTITNDGRGLKESSVTFFTSNYTPDSVAIGSDHPYDKTMKCYKTSVAIKKNGIAYITADYNGVANTTSTIEIETSSATSEEPIQTHPYFSNWAVVSTSNGITKWKSGVVVDDNSNFVEFGPTMNFSLGGVTSYLVAGTVIRNTFYTTSSGVASASIAKVGKIRYPTQNFGSTQRFLCTNASVNTFGSVYKITEEFQAGNWNGFIYYG